MLVRILRAERLPDAVRTFVKEHLGVMFVTAIHFDLQEIFSESDPKVPLIFILAPGMFPHQLFAKTRGFANRSVML